MITDIQKHNSSLSKTDKEICELLMNEINKHLTTTEHKIWHAHPVWFINGNPIVGYSKEKKGIRLMFWSGASFEDEKLNIRGKKFKDASIFYNYVSEINTQDLLDWLKKAISIQWDYKNLVKKKGRLDRLS